MSIKNNCPCFSGKEYSVCCAPFHKGEIPENALLLMRSRYAAYALNLPEYIIATTHPASPQYQENKFAWKRSISRFAKHTTFENLEILDFKEKGNVASVTFTAYVSQEAGDVTFTEKSHFEKRGNRWLYRIGKLEKGRAPGLIKEGPLKLLPLSYYGDPILRRKADEISMMTAETRKLIDEMVETMDVSEGIGIAAPQIHHSIRLFVIRQPILKEDNKLELGEVKVFINPELSSYSLESWKAPEGCLSIPSIRAEVERPKEVVVEYTSIHGDRIKEQVSGWEARVIMHEYDHIQGVLFIDRLNAEEQSKLMPFLQDLEQRMSL